MDDDDDGAAFRVDEPGGRRSVILEDDGRVAYAYLLEDDEIIGDVWLYNVGGDPEVVDFEDRDAMPFQNPAACCAGREMERITDDTDIDCVWSATDVTILVEGVPWARLARGSTPGWSRNARASNPLARPLD